MNETPTATAHCEHCSNQFVPAADDKYEGQICPVCMTKGSPVYVIMDSEDDDDKRYHPGLEITAEYLDEGVWGEWQEFNGEEYKVIGEEWSKLPSLDTSSLEALQASLDAKLAFMQEFWKNHHDILEAREVFFTAARARDEARGWKPAHTWSWLNVPEFKTLIIREVR